MCVGMLLTRVQANAMLLAGLLANICGNSYGRTSSKCMCLAGARTDVCGTLLAGDWAGVCGNAFGRSTSQCVWEWFWHNY
jgi:hypothetical protein